VNSQVFFSRGRALAKFVRHWHTKLLSVNGFVGQSQALTKKKLMPEHPGMAASVWHHPPAVTLELMVLGAFSSEGLALSA